jgi:site-specific recombinase XerD
MAICTSPSGRCSSPRARAATQRLVPVPGRFFAAVGNYLDRERPANTATDRLFVVLKGEHRRPLTADGVREILDGARRQASAQPVVVTVSAMFRC